MRTRILAILLVTLLAPGAATGQAVTPDRRVQLGLGLLPGVGIQTGYVAPHLLYTTEGMLNVDVTPPYAGGEGSVQVSLGIGGAVRPLGLVRLFTNNDYGAYDLDLGLRFGPALFFAFNESKEAKNQRFSLFLEPYARLTSSFGTRYTFFAEAGMQRPLLRAGLWLEL